MNRNFKYFTTFVYRHKPNLLKIEANLGMVEQIYQTIPLKQFQIEVSVIKIMIKKPQSIKSINGKIWRKFFSHLNQSFLCSMIKDPRLCRIFKGKRILFHE